MLLDSERPLIQRALWLDGVISLAAGILCLPFLSWLAGELGIGAAPVLALALFMAAYGALMLRVAPHATRAGRGLWAIVIGNGLWVLGSVALAFSEWIAPTRVGIALLLGQAAIVLAITELQFFGLRRSLRLQVA